MNLKKLKMRQENKTEIQDPIVMQDDGGSSHRVSCVVSSFRVQMLDDSWSDWQVSSRRFTANGKHVNQLEDGWYEFAMTGQRIRPE